MSIVESNIRALARKMHARANNVERGTKKGLDNVAKYAVQQEKALTTVNKKSGKLARSMTWIRSGDYTRLVNPIIAEHGKYLDQGRGPVFPKTKKALAFTIKGNKVVVKSVGPAKARPFIEPTKKGLKVMYPRIMSVEIKKALR